MDDLYRAFDDRAQVILQRIDAKQWDLLVGVIESTDRVQHMMWRLIDPAHPMYDKALAAKFGDSIERVYRKCDEFVGEVVSRARSGDADPDRLRPRVPLVPPVGQPEHLARAGRLHGDPGPAAGREEAEGPVRRRHLLGKRRLDAHQGLRDGPRPDLRQPARAAKGHGIVAPADSKAVQDAARGAAADDDRSDDRRADGGCRLQARRHLQGPVPATTRRSCRSASPTATVCRGSRRSAARRRGSSIRT